MVSEKLRQYYPAGRHDFIEKSVAQGMKRIKDKFSTVFVIDGDVGCGKTTFSVLFGDECHGQEIDLKKNLALGGEDFQKKILATHERGDHVLIYDEAGEFNKRGAMTKFNRDMNRLFEMSRALKILVIIVLPRFYILDRQFFELNQVRGVFHIHSRRKSEAAWTAYTTGQAMYIKKWAEKLTVPQTAYNYGAPIAKGAFKDLSPERSQLLEKISIEAKKDAISDLFMKKDKLSKKDIMKHYGYSSHWLELRLAKLGDNVNREKVGNKYYYDKSIIQRIDALLKEE